MPSSSYMPNLVVEIAWPNGFATPSASRTWTDVSDYVELAQGISITYGRGDERSTADANQLSLTLDNRDGRFTPGKASSPYYPNVKLDRPIRVTATPVDGAAQVEFVGFVNEWPVEWEGSDGYAKVTITASSRMARLGTQAGLKSIVEQTILADSPVAYFTLGEPAGATQANDSSGNAVSPMTLFGAGAPVVFGSATGPGTDSLTAAQFGGGQSLLGGNRTAVGTGVSVEAFFLADAPPPFGSVTEIVSVNTVALALTATGAIRAFTTAGYVDSATSYADGATHHAAAVWDGSTIQLYIDGLLNVSLPAVAAVPAIRLLSVGGEPSAEVFTGTIAHAAFFSVALTPTQVLLHALSGLTGFATAETASGRISRYAGFAGIPSAELNLESGSTNVQHVDTTDRTVLDLMRLMEATEGGVLFDQRDGMLGFHNRGHRLKLSALYTLDMGQHMVEASYSPRLDRSFIANDVTAADVTGGVTAHVLDAAAKLDNGVATASLETASVDKDEPLYLASWTLYKYKTPLPRVASLAVDCLAQVGKTPNCSAVLATNLGDKITVSNRPSQDSTSSASFFVEGYTRVYGPESCVTTFNVSPSSPEDTTFILGDSTRGVLGTNPLAL